MVGPSRLLTAGLLAVLASVSACTRDTPATLTDIHGVAALQQRFNIDAGRPRVVLLLSPT